jgi:hypothetical protein
MGLLNVRDAAGITVVSVPVSLIELGSALLFLQSPHIPTEPSQCWAKARTVRSLSGCRSIAAFARGSR